MLTGIGRFKEMSYIFEALADEHHFELLFRKDIEKVTFSICLLFVCKDSLARIIFQSGLRILCFPKYISLQGSCRPLKVLEFEMSFQGYLKLLESESCSLQID